jgi:pimeloyl-ACP methyl ester carboxylesterase
MPIAFLTGSLDPVRFMMAGVAEAMGDLLPDFRGVIEIDDVGHWIQQERPEETTSAVLRFLDATK